MKSPSLQRVKTEIKNLQKIKPNVRPCSHFGDNHWKAIDVQVIVLTAFISKRPWSEEDIDETWGSEGNIYDAAQMARRWLQGEPLDPDDKTIKTLVDSWKELMP